MLQPCRLRVHPGEIRVFSVGVSGRAVQLDGLRAVAMLAICWDHWCPAHWPRVFPFEVFLFFFLVMTGYLITGSLLRERARGDARGEAWRLEALRIYQIRRGLRILAPYYAALALGLVVLAPDIWRAPLWYVFHVSNIHMAFLGEWPAGTNHFWSLALQQQFYLVWPFVIWWLPRKWIPVAICLCIAAGPLTRSMHDSFTAWCPWPQVLTWASLDYFGVGALFAWAVHRGMSLESPGLRWLSWLALAAYVAIAGGHSLGWETYGFRSYQQTFLSIAVCGLIAAGSVGFYGWFGRMLETSFLQRVGALSYGVYLFHNLAPLVAGKLFWFLWGPAFRSDAFVIPRVAIFAAITWGLTLASWHWIELPLQRLRSRIVHSNNAAGPPAGSQNR